MKNTTLEGYGSQHQKLRKRFAEVVLAGGVRCARCGEAILPGQPWDLGHVDGDKGRYSGPEHVRCNRATSGRRPALLPEIVEEPERVGLEASDDRWRVPWLKGLRRPPKGAVWPRLMTVPHSQAVGSLGPEFVEWAEARSNRPLRWWQKLVATRLLEVNGAGELVWETLILSVARQVGKSWLLRELLFWRIHQNGRFGEPQDVIHTGKDLAVCKEIQRPARVWAKQRDAYKVREVNGQEEIELVEDNSRWMLRAKEAVYGYSVSCAAVDEAWKVKASAVDEGLVATMVERSQPQLLLVSTAHRKATSLILVRRQVALDELETGTGDLLIEWSTPKHLTLDDVGGWRLASPYWTPRREKLVRAQLDKARAGDLDDPDEPDPEQSFRAQWLNQWPSKPAAAAGPTEPLLAPGLWANLAVPNATSSGPIWVAVEDDYGLGAAVAAAGRTDDGRIEVDGWLCDDWDAAIADVARLKEHRQIRHLQVGGSMLDRVPSTMSPRPAAAGARNTRAGLPLLRDLAVIGGVVHDPLTKDLNDALAVARVRESSAGLWLVNSGPTHLVKALVWCLAAAHKPAPLPAIY